MKGKRYFIIGCLLSGIIGWTLGFLRLPYLEGNSSFAIGFACCFCLLILGWMGIIFWKKNKLILQTLGQKADKAPFSASSRTYLIIWSILAVITLLGTIGSSFLLYQQLRFSRQQMQRQNEIIAQQAAINEAARKSNLRVLTNDLFDQIEQELRRSPDKQLSNALINRIAVLNFTFKPYKVLKADSLSSRLLSPERGQMLLILTRMNMDSSSFNSIKQLASFAHADLQGADLSGADLSGIDLTAANLEDANLRAARLDSATLKNANLWAAQLSESSLQKANLERATLNWANLSNADLSEARLNGANLSAARLSKARLIQADVTYALLENAFLNESILENTNLSFTSLRYANLSKANLQNAILKTTDLSYAVLEQANLQGVNLRWSIIDNNKWFDQLQGWKVNGRESLQQNFQIIPDVAGLGNFRLPPKD